MKKQLVIQSISNREVIDHSEDHLFKKSHWVIEIHYDINENIMEVVEIRPKKKIKLTEVMEVICQQSQELVPETVGDCGYRVYRLK